MSDISVGSHNGRWVTGSIYVIAFVTGGIVMSFEMLGSRYLNPYFGSGIYTWASLISTVLAALTLGYFIGGWLADRVPSIAVLGATVTIGSAYLLVLPLFAQGLLEWVLDGIDDVKLGSMLAAVTILFFPVCFLGMYSPFAIRLLIRSALTSGKVSGTVYGVSTVGSIVGTLGTTFYLLPSVGSFKLTLSLGGAGCIAGLALMLMRRVGVKAAATVAGALVLMMALSPGAQSEGLIDDKLRAALLRRPDGLLAHIETVYNDIFVSKRRGIMAMSFQLKGWEYTQSEANLRDADDLPVPYTRAMTIAVAVAENAKRILMIGLGGGTISTYLGRAMPDAAIDTVEVDPDVITTAKKYFGIRETATVKYFPGDGRVWLKRHARTYDVIVVDAYHGGYVPFHMMTKEFYELVRQRLAPGGAAVFNVHDGTKLYISTIKTLGAVFPSVQLFPSGAGETAIVVTHKPPSDDAVARRAAALDEKYRFRFPLAKLVKTRVTLPSLKNADMLTDDFAPVELYKTIGRRPRKKSVRSN
jgi:spermidine synthase